MNTHTLNSKFSQGLNWNALFYTAYKLSSTILSITLFKFLSTKDFSTWANINSIIFLSLLWIDCGMRKSIPRYCPEFAKDKHAQKRFITYILVFQTCLTAISLPFFIYALTTMSTVLNLQNNTTLFSLSCVLFCIEALVSLLRLIYHAHFWIKQFNTMNAAVLLVEMIINGVIIMISTDSTQIIIGMFVTKALSSIAMAVACFGMLPQLYRDKDYPGNGVINFKHTIIQFMQHSGAMWINNNVKSLTERNFLMPLFTYTLGQPIANLFKVANDGALLFYRIVLKTVGTTDTSLLAHVAVSTHIKSSMVFAFQKLSSKIAALCIPLLGILVLISIKSEYIFMNHFVFQAFFIMTIGYIVELVLSPYERMLEINRQYRYLLYAYIPYIIVVITLLLSPIISWIGLLSTLMCIQGVRLVSSCIMMHYVRARYVVQYPFKLILIIIFLILFCLFLFLIPYS